MKFLIRSVGVVVLAVVLIVPSIAHGQPQIPPEIFREIHQLPSPRYYENMTWDQVKAASLDSTGLECVERTAAATPDSGIPFVRRIAFLSFPQGWQRVTFKGSENLNINTLPTYYFCPPQALTAANLQNNEAIDYSTPEGFLRFVLLGIATLINWLVQTILNFVGHWLQFTITFSDYVTNPFVTRGWTFVQGIANLGFIFALLFIAFATTLRIESWSARRVLPRLFIAALLLNFSLVIGGVLIDGSRLAMAGIFRLITFGGNPDNLAHDILDKARFYLLMENLNKMPTGLDTVFPWPTYLATFFLVLMAIAMFLLSIVFMVRHIVLLLLLVVSPLAYLAFAFPNLEGLAKRWWSSFLSWVLYGPVVIFILAIAVSLTGTMVTISSGTPDGDPKDPFRNFIVSGLQVFAVMVLIWIAVIAGRFTGALGANAAVNAALRVGRGGARAAGRTARVTGRVATAVPRAGLRAGGRFVANQARDFGGEIGGALRRYAKDQPLLRPFVPARRDSQGKPLKGEETYAQKLGRAAGGAVDPRAARRRDQADAAATVAQNDANLIANINNAAVSGAMLRQQHVAERLGVEKLEVILQNTDRVSQASGLAGNKDYLRQLNDDQRNQLLTALQNNAHLNPQERSTALNKILQTLHEIDNE